MKFTKPYKFILFSLVLLIGAAIFSFFRIGHWLSEDDELRASDAILVLSGSLAERPLFAADLYQQNYADTIYLSRAVKERSVLDELGIRLQSQLEINRMVFEKRGIPAKDIALTKRPAKSTAEEAVIFGETIPNSLHCLIVVTSPYHVARTRMIFTEQFPQRTIFVVGSPYSGFNREWWKDQSSAGYVIHEVAKIIFYRLGGRFFGNVSNEKAPGKAVSTK